MMKFILKNIPAQVNAALKARKNTYASKKSTSFQTTPQT